MTKTYRTLAIDDDQDNYMLVCMALDGLPLDIVNAGTGAEAIAILRREVPDLILLDINLPDMRGWDVLDQIKNDNRFGESRIIVFTANSDPVHRLIGRLQPITSYLSKGAGVDELRARVRDLLQF